jgi:Serine aminopeptidase, S33
MQPCCITMGTRSTLACLIPPSAMVRHSVPNKIACLSYNTAHLHSSRFRLGKLPHSPVVMSLLNINRASNNLNISEWSGFTNGQHVLTVNETMHRHSESHSWVATVFAAFRRFAEAGIAVFAFDAHGFGKSKRAAPAPLYVATMEDFIDDVYTFREVNILSQEKTAM